jgi:tetrapyrrole methylase family protein/MazG family protein
MPAGLVRVVGLGPGRPSLITREALEAIEATPVRWLRTSRHPSAAAVPGARSFDYLYEQASTLEEVYAGIVDALVESATEEGSVLYAVPGSPLVAERTVELLIADDRVATEVLPGVSFAELAYLRLGIDPVEAGARFVDGRRFGAEAAGERGPFLVSHCDSPQVLSEVKLALGALADAEPNASVPELTVLQRLSLPDEVVAVLRWEDLDREVAPDHLTALWVPKLGASFAAEMVRLEDLGRTLRARCPWDRQQTHESLTRYLIEEAYETVEAIEELGPGGGGYEHLEEELGDVLFQVVFHSVLAAEEGHFTLADVARAVHEKLVARHPHVFAGAEAATPEAVAKNWEQLKRKEREKAGPGAGHGLPRSLPALLYAYKVQQKLASSGLDWQDVAGPLEKVSEELSELSALLGDRPSPGSAEAAREEVGDLLFAAVNLARHLKVDPEAALRQAVAKFRGRAEALEALAASRGLDPRQLDLASLDALWEEVKARQPLAGHER